MMGAELDPTGVVVNGFGGATLFTRDGHVWMTSLEHAATRPGLHGPAGRELASHEYATLEFTHALGLCSCSRKGA